MIEVSGLTKRFGTYTAVSDLSLRVEPGRIYGFLGPNGAGKTTTVKMLTGLLRPSAGTARICGFDVASDTLEAKRRLGLVPDEPFVYPKLTGAEFLRLTGDLYEVPYEVQRRRVPELLEMFELTGFGGELLETYSHGMRQKVVLASVILHEPKALILDEPLVGLDPKSARMAKEIFRTMAARGAAIFMCTHVLEIAERICDRIGIILGGRLVAEGTLAELRSRSGPAAQGRSLEEIFLELTGGQEYAALLKNL
ncbi:MAG: ABC transporter ATP-binding protein [Elusimicrobia bacterium]|nr:ABC transporter ATP-binding protein [Elusimicrobiota bacterium]